LRAECFSAAAANLLWLLVYAPGLRPSIYINRSMRNRRLAGTEQDAKKTIVYLASAPRVHGVRSRYFNERGDVVNRKADEAYKFYRDNSRKYAGMLEMFQKAFELNGDNVMNVNTIAYMDVIRRAKLSGGSMTDDEILEKYDQISKVIDNKMA